MNEIQNLLPFRFQYLVLERGVRQSPQSIELENKAYLYWEAFWNDVFKSNGDSQRVSADDFIRPHFLTMICHEQEIVALHFYQVFHLNLVSNWQHSYFLRSFNDAFVQHLRTSGMKSAMSMEYATINPSYRKSRLGFSLISVLTGLGLELQRSLSIETAIAISRSDVGVTRLAQDFGAQIIVNNVMAHNTPCDLITIPTAKISSHPNPYINNLVQSLWKKKIWFSQMPNYIEESGSEDIAI